MSDSAADHPDTPVPNPPSALDKIKGFIGDLARPWVLYVSAGSAAGATVWIAVNGDLSAGALYIGSAWSGVALLYGAKAIETATTAKHTASVEKAKVQAGPYPVEPLAPVTPIEDPAMFNGPRA